MFTCPVCFYGAMPDPPTDYNICPCCGTEFENSNADCSYDELRADWIVRGTPWFFRNAPQGWNPWLQLLEANVVPPYDGAVMFYGGDVSQEFVAEAFFGQMQEDAKACYA